eukprot:GFYU01022443.1.p2 GENE.GFYU01022443.1~~GFYU01022443.1.p2  ORF type:complete len:172 (+),score=19.87 GFYU01022443.1:694-1209(+)
MCSECILRKQHKLAKAYDGYDVNTIAQYTDTDVERLMKNPDVIRHRLKIDAIINNAQVVRSIATAHGSLHRWLVTRGPNAETDAGSRSTERKEGVGSRDETGGECTRSECRQVTVGEWTRLLKSVGFRFVGEKVAKAWLTSLGILPGAHTPNCAIYHRVLAAQPHWLTHTS